MLIKNLFVRDIFRPINGVVKADQLDDSSVWQELDEFVVTKEMDQHLRKFFGSYLDAIDHKNDVEIGVQSSPDNRAQFEVNNLGRAWFFAGVTERRRHMKAAVLAVVSGDLYGCKPDRGFVFHFIVERFDLEIGLRRFPWRARQLEDLYK